MLLKCLLKSLNQREKSQTSARLSLCQEIGYLEGREVWCEVALLCYIKRQKKTLLCDIFAEIIMTVCEKCVGNGESLYYA